MTISVIVPAHNSHHERLLATLCGLAAQTLPSVDFEVIVVDNASDTPPDAVLQQCPHLANARIVREPRLGLTFARLAGIAHARADLLAFVDDDNVLAADYLEQAARIFGESSELGAAGGRIIASFATEPPPWAREFFSLLAIRDLGAARLISAHAPGQPVREYPAFSPVGAGMVIRKTCAAEYVRLAHEHDHRLAFDRKGGSLSSGGDNDLVFTVLESGWRVGYFPELQLTHLIPTGRLEPAYLARLAHDLARTWVLVLAEHGIRPWPPISQRTLPLRKARAWLRHQAWRGPPNFVRWRSACGSFEGRSQLSHG